MLHLHTRVANDIREACTHNGVLDLEQQSEMQMECPEYANEIMGRYDEEYDPYDRDGENDEYADEEYEGDEGEEIEDVGCEQNIREDFGWDGGMEP